MNDNRAPRFRWTAYRFTGEHGPCRLCGSASLQVVGTRDRWLNPLRNVVCTGCGLVRLDPMPTKDEVTAYYSHVYRSHYHGSERPRPKATLRALKSAAARVAVLPTYVKPGARILDVGAASGEFVHLARKDGYVCDGIEPNIAFAAFAKETYGVELQTGSWEDAAIAPGSYDVITMFHVLEHLRDPVPVMSQLHSWLAPGGLLAISVPDIARTDRMPTGKWHFGHKHGYSRETLEMLGRRTGFSVTPASLPVRSPDLVLARESGPLADWLNHPGHAAELATRLSRHTVVRHMLSATPYRRAAQRYARFGREFMATSGAHR